MESGRGWLGEFAHTSNGAVRNAWNLPASVGGGLAPTDRPLHHPRPGIYNAVSRSDRFGTGHRLGIQNAPAGGPLQITNDQKDNFSQLRDEFSRSDSLKEKGWMGGGRLLASASAPQERWGALDRAPEPLGRTSERHMARQREIGAWRRDR